MAESRKVLVAFDPEQPGESSSDFLVPVRSGSGELEFFGTRSKKSSRYGAVILTSRPITENDLFAKLVDAGCKVPNVADALDTLTRFLEAMKTTKVGNVVELARGANDSVSLDITANTPRAVRTTVLGTQLFETQRDFGLRVMKMFKGTP